jgi:hypothetical protein
VTLSELSRKLDSFFPHGKCQEWQEKDTQLKYRSGVLSGTDRSSRADVEQDDLLDHGDQHGFLHYNAAASYGVPKKWGTLGWFYTTVYMGVIQATVWHVVKLVPSPSTVTKERGLDGKRSRYLTTTELF